MVRIQHTGSFEADIPKTGAVPFPAAETKHGEDINTTTHLLEGILGAGYGYKEATEDVLPLLVANVKSERLYRRGHNRNIKLLGHSAGRHLYGQVVTYEDAAKMLLQFDTAIADQRPSEKLGLEVGHIEIPSSNITFNDAWRQLDDFGEAVAIRTGLDVVDAHRKPRSSQTANFKTETETLSRARTNFPVVDIGHVGIQEFVRMSVGYTDPRKARLSVSDVHGYHEAYLDTMADTKGVAVIDEKRGVLAYPISATLVGLHRPD